MTGIASKILARIRRAGRDSRIFSAKDFLSLGSRAAVDTALSRLFKAGSIRRVRRGLYDLPRHSALLKVAVPPNIDAVAKAVGAVAADSIAAANGLGLTTAVSVRPIYLTAGPSRTVTTGKTAIELRHAPGWLLAFAGTSAMPFVQALYWLGRDGAAAAVGKLKAKITLDVARALRRHPVVGWLAEVVRDLTAGVGPSHEGC